MLLSTDTQSTVSLEAPSSVDRQKACIDPLKTPNDPKDAPIDPKEEPTGPQDTHIDAPPTLWASFRSKDRPLLAFKQKLELLSSNNSTASTDLLSSPMFR